MHDAYSGGFTDMCNQCIFSIDEYDFCLMELWPYLVQDFGAISEGWDWMMKNGRLIFVKYICDGYIDHRFINPVIT